MPIVIVRENKQKVEKKPKVVEPIDLVQFMRKNLSSEFRIEGSIASLFGFYYIHRNSDGKIVGYRYTEDDAMGGVHENIEVLDKSFQPEAERVATQYEKETGEEEVAIFVPSEPAVQFE